MSILDTLVDDQLELAYNKSIRDILLKLGKSNEHVLLSIEISIINRKNELQKRVLMVTDHSVYNLERRRFHRKLYTLKRKISMNQLRTVTLSGTTNEFVLHVDGEYDYCFVSPNRRSILQFISRVRETVLKLPALTITSIPKDDINYSVVHRGETDRIHQRTVQRVEQELIVSTRERMEAVESRVATPIVQIDQFERITGDTVLQGSLGRVYSAVFKATGQVFSIKHVITGLEADDDARAHFFQEVKALQILGYHPFIQQMQYVLEDGAGLYLVSSYYGGGDLFDYLQANAPLTEDRIRRLSCQIVLALGHCHSKGIVYRDCKPENILLDDGGFIRLIDFDISKTVNSKANSFCGSCGYMAPQVLNDDEYGVEVDWWSLGVVVYELVYGRSPFYDPSPLAMYDNIQSASIRFTSNISKHLQHLIQSLLNRSPRHRLGFQGGAAQVLSHPFFNGIDLLSLYEKSTYK